MFEMRGRGTACLAAWLMMLAIAVPAGAQITTGTLAGSVSDAQGLGVPGATIVLISEGRRTRSAPAVTGAAGDFVIAGVLPDSYTIEVTMPGFKTLTRQNVAVSGGERVAVGALKLEVGGMTEQVDVTSEAPLIQVQSGERSFTVESAAVQALPLANRNFAGLTTLTPGVTGTARIGGGGQNNIMIDGISSMDTGNNGQMLQLNVDAIAEVKVLTSGYQAEFGRSSGMQISAVTKTGTNRFRGSVYDIERNSDWNANSWTNIQNGNAKAVSKEKDWGYTIGGPVGKPGGNNKVFFFHSMEFRPREAGGNVQRFRLPTELERVGDFSQSRDNNGNPIPQLRDPITRAIYPNNIIPADKIYKPGQAILNWWPALPNITQAPGTNYNFETTSPVENLLSYQPAVTGDYQVSTNLRISARYGAQNGRAKQPIATGSIPGFNDTLDSHGRPWRTTWSASVSYTFNATTFLEATYGRAQNTLGNIPSTSYGNRFLSGMGDLPLLFPNAGMVPTNSYNHQALSNANLPIFVNGEVQGIPQFSWGNLIGAAPPNINYPNFLNINRSQDVSINITRVQGRHTLKAGFYLNHAWKGQNLDPGGGGGRFYGAIDFTQSTDNPLDSGFGYANAMLGVFTSYSQQSSFVEGSFISNNRDFYVQDNWKVNGRLTLDFGLRFVNQEPGYDSNLQASNFFPSRWSASVAPKLFQPGCSTNVYPCSNAQRVALNPVTGQLLGQGSAAVIGQVVPGSGDPLNGIVQQGVAPNNKFNYEWPLISVSPRFGVAYDWTGTQKLVVRGSFGVFYDRPEGNSYFQQIGNPPTSSFTTVRYGLLSDLSNRNLLRSENVPLLTTYHFDNDRLPGSAQWNGGMQVALPFSMSLDVSYVGQHSYDRPPACCSPQSLNSLDYGTAYLASSQDPTRQPSAVPGANALTQSLLAPYIGIGEINEWSQDFSRTFHSIQISGQRRFSRGFSGGLNYTWTLQDVSNEGVALRYEHGADGSVRLRSDQDEYEQLNNDVGTRTHQLKGNFVWDLPDVQLAGQPGGARRRGRC